MEVMSLRAVVERSNTNVRRRKKAVSRDAIHDSNFLVVVISYVSLGRYLLIWYIDGYLGLTHLM